MLFNFKGFNHLCLAALMVLGLASCAHMPQSAAPAAGANTNSSAVGATDAGKTCDVGDKKECCAQKEGKEECKDKKECCKDKKEECKDKCTHEKCSHEKCDGSKKEGCHKKKCGKCDKKDGENKLEEKK